MSNKVKFKEPFIQKKDIVDLKKEEEEKKKNFSGKEENKLNNQQLKNDQIVEEKGKIENNENKKLDQILTKTRKIIFEASSIFPFDLFPDKIRIDLAKVDVINHELYKSGEAHSIYIKDIGDVFLESSIIFATLKIIDTSLKASKPSDYVIIKMRYLKKSDAEKAFHIIQGLIFAEKNGLKLENLKGEDLVSKIEKLGTAEKI